MSMREDFESKMAGEAMLDWDDGMQEYRSVVTQKMWVTWQAARATDSGSQVVPEWMAEISQNLKTQDNRITADPLFVVFQKREIVTHEDFDYDRISWGSSDGEAPEEIQEQLNELYGDVESDFFREDQITHTSEDGTETWQRAALKEIDEFVTACFTEAGAEAYLKSNGHNLRQPFIYVTSLFRNEEMKNLREWLSTSPGNGWVRCEDEWPHTEEVIWVDDNSYPKPTLLDVGFLQMAIDLGRVRHWMPTGLKRPQPPTGESK